MPIECYQGNCFAEKIEGVRCKAGYISQLRLQLQLVLTGAFGGRMGGK